NPACKTQPVPYITKSQVIWLLNEKQRDPRLNEIIYPYANENKARELIAKFEPDNAFVEKDQLSSRGLHAYLISTDNNVVPLEKLDLSQDMEQPLAHYFINSSHNTYLSGHQLTGKSSVELYRQVLLTGC
uniref:Phosphoinositide phospholipase C n=1 Tax=Macrostomum lignano TaxID=282301 RepID=A0A1I8JCD9_9PLAT